MAMNEFEKALVYAAGATFRFDPYDDDGNPTGLAFPGDVSSLTSSAESEKVERKAHTRGDDGSPAYGSVIGELESERTLTYEVTFGSWTDLMFAAYYFGNASPFNQTAGAAAPVEITVGALDAWQGIGGHRFIESVTAESAGGSAIPAADFEISPRTGLIRFKSGGSVSAGDVVTVTPTLKALTSATRIAIMERKTPLSGRMVIDLFNRVSGQPRDMLIDLRKVSLSPTGNADLMGEEFMDLQFSMSIQYDSAVNPATNKPYGYGDFILGQHPRA